MWWHLGTAQSGMMLATEGWLESKVERASRGVQLFNKCLPVAKSISPQIFFYASKSKKTPFAPLVDEHLKFG
jgi:hypothetical protein